MLYNAISNSLDFGVRKISYILKKEKKVGREKLRKALG